MTVIVTTDVATGQTIDPSVFNSNFTAVKATVNGNLDNANISSGAAISVSKLAAGTETHILTTSGGVAAWVAPSGGGGGDTIPPGSISMYGGSSAPTDWLLCDGSAASRSTYADLYAAIGTLYGVGDGSTTFNLPDLRGRVAVGLNSGGPSEVNTMGDNDGTAVANRTPSHHHTFTSGSQTGFSTYITRQALDTGITTTSTSGGTPLNAPSYLVVNFIIKT